MLADNLYPPPRSVIRLLRCWPSLLRWQLALLLALFAAGGVGVGAWMESRRRPVVVPVSSWPGYEYMSLAAHQGLDRAQGIRIEPRRYRDSQLIVQDLAWGRLQGRLKVCPGRAWRACRPWLWSAGLTAPDARNSLRCS